LLLFRTAFIAVFIASPYLLSKGGPKPYDFEGNVKCVLRHYNACDDDIPTAQAHPNPSGNWSEWLLAKLHLPNPMAENIPNKPLDYYTCPFKTSKLDR
jgi:hypothetical protein